jgi:uracil-DNA glycosylase
MDKSERIQLLSDKVVQCKHCDLYKTRTNPVLGEGSLDADLFFIGEAPGFNEDKQGRPFVGRAGAILDELLASIDLKRSDIYISNILKCRPPKNRNPTEKEIKVCTPFLERQIELISPKVIIPMGSFSSEYIFNKFDLHFTKISELHGKVFTKTTLYNTLHILPMYHPAVATYNPNKKNVLLEDIKKVKPFIFPQSVTH